MAYLLNQLLSKSAERLPERTAVWAEGKALSYRELDERSNQFARFLRERGVRKGDRIGLYFPKAVESVVAMFGALKTGAVYVPLDPQQPAERIVYIIGNCGMKGLVTNPERLAGLTRATIPSVDFSLVVGGAGGGGEREVPWSALSSFPVARPPEDHYPTTTDLAYILYTSGSTGRPKGVMLSHQNALTFVEWCAEEFQIRPEDRLSNHAPLHFDLSVFDIYNAIEAGASVHMISEEVKIFPASLAKFLRDRRISVLYCVPSALVQLVLHGSLKSENLERLRLILFAGESLHVKYLRQLVELLPTIEFYNLYGPTETNVCTYYRVDRQELAGLEKLPIGRACANTEVFAVNEQGEMITEPGETGELWVRGPSVTPGYWGDPEKTRRTVVSNPFQPYFEEKAYRTGDVVVLRADGGYDFTGRRDNQIKSRGYRIELGEIETALLSHPGVREAAAVAVPDPEIGARLQAYVAAHNGKVLTVAEVQQHCASKIPAYMIPERIEMRDSLPKTSTGKIDRVRLASEAAPAGSGD